MATPTMSERILIVAEHPQIATLWMQLNTDALQHPEHDVQIIAGIDVRSVTVIPKADRLIIIGQPERSIVAAALAAALAATKAKDRSVVRMQHTDRLAAGWRTA